jgi:radical SAM family protein
LRIVALAPPGRFPTVVPDLPWWGAVAATGHELDRPSVNARWWRDLCSPAGAGSFASDSRSTRATATDAGAALGLLQAAETFATRDRYRSAVGAVGRLLDRLNDAQPDVRLFFAAGPRVRGLMYEDSRTIVRYAMRATPLANSVERALRVVRPDPDLAVISVTSREELLTALIAVRLLKRRTPNLFAVLADHSSGSYSLTPHVEALARSGAMGTVFDAVIVKPGERDALVPAIVRELEMGRRPAGFLRRGDLPDGRWNTARTCAPPPTETFAPAPVARLRLSGGRCYWDRCTFCVQAESLSNRPPSVSDVPGAVERLERFVAAGYRHAILADEALAPAFLARLCEVLEERAVPISWACRSKLERTFSSGLFESIARAGCTEVLFGLESIVPRVLRLMDKETPGLDAEGISRICRDAAGAGIGVHLNLIAGFPGERRDELEASVAFVERQLAVLPFATFSLTPFLLFNEAPIANDPATPVLSASIAGDMPFIRTHSGTNGWEGDRQRIVSSLPRLERRLRRAAGWGDDRASRRACELIAETGHGLLFKAAGIHGPDSPHWRAA